MAVQPITRRIAFANSCRCWICPYQSFAKSIHKGEDIEDGVVDLGDTEVDLGMSYVVGVSRFKALSSFKMVWLTWQRFKNIGADVSSKPKFKTMQAREAEAKRIDGLVAAT